MRILLMIPYITLDGNKRYYPIEPLGALSLAT